MNIEKITKNNVERFDGFADDYDKFRPVPPLIIVETLINYINKPPALVGDLGCGTGLSTFIWKDYSDKVIGIEPNRDMLNKAKEKWDKSSNSKKVEFQQGYGNDTGLKSSSADIITCSSSFQWMEPSSTIKEVSRVLVDQGVFAMYYHGSPAVGDWVVEKAYSELFQKVYSILDNSIEKEGKVKLWSRKEYIDTMKSSGNFKFMKEILVHSKVQMNADDLIGFAFSQGALQEVIKRDIKSTDDEINKFIDIVRKRIGNKVFDGVYSYNIILSIK